MLKKTVFLAMLAVGLTLLPALGEAALRPQTENAPSQEENPKSFYNPKEAEDNLDLELPMPCGLKMVVRPVAIHVGKLGILGDKEFKMGLGSTDEGRSFYEKRMDAYVNGPFFQENFPAAWQGKLPADEKDSYCYYFIGKYEITNAQWAAVMEDKLVTEGGNLPKTNISWYDIQEFLQKYNTWLHSEHAGEVPNIDGCPAFFRLPTEEEWEFAARGGNLPSEMVTNNDMPYLKEDDSVADYAVFGRGEPLPVGSLKMNPLGLYDMAGNAAELVQSGFRFTISVSAGGRRFSRFHGSEGGFLMKGGSFQSVNEKDVYPGKREEANMFERKAPFSPLRARFLGARLVLASINVPGAARSNRILEDEKSLSSGISTAQGPAQAAEGSPTLSGQEQPGLQTGEARTKPGRERLVSLDPNGDPLQELEKIYAATASPFMKSNLDQLRDLLRGLNGSLARERDENLLGALRAAVYQVDSLINIAFRCYQLNFMLNDTKSRAKVPADIEKRFKNQILEHYRNLEVATNFYRRSVENIAAYPKKDVSDKIAQLRKEYAGEDKLNKIFRDNLEALAEHVDFVGTQGVDRLTNSKVWTRTIPPKGMRPLVLQLEKETHKKKGK